MSSYCRLCQGYESDGSDYVSSLGEGSDGESDTEGETESEHEISSCSEYEAPSDEEGPDPDSRPVSDDDAANSDSDDGQSDEKYKHIGSDNTDEVEAKNDRYKTGELDDDDEEKNKLPKEILDFKQNKGPKPSIPDLSGDKYLRHGSSISSQYASRGHLGASHDEKEEQSRSRHSRHLYSEVVMPTGRKYLVSVPQADNRNWKCGSKTKLITLRPDGKLGKREYSIISKQMEKTRRHHTTGRFTGYIIEKIEKIVNPCLWKQYRHRRRVVQAENTANEKMLFHGSPHWTDLMLNGFDERYSNIYDMFGAGLYFAVNSSKSNQYVYGLTGRNRCPTHKATNCMLCERTMLLCRVILGKTKQYTTARRLAHPPSGYNSVEGVPSYGGLRYSENVVYRGEQVYPEYLVTYKLKP